MKTNSPLFTISLFFPLVVFTLSSCSGVMNLQKRHYREGFYIPKHKIFQHKESITLSRPQIWPRHEEARTLASLVQHPLPGNIESPVVLLLSGSAAESENAKPLSGEKPALQKEKPASPANANNDPAAAAEKAQNKKIAGILALAMVGMVLLGLLLLPLEAAGLVFVAALALGVAALSYLFKKTDQEEEAKEQKEKEEAEQDEKENPGSSKEKVRRQERLIRVLKIIAITTVSVFVAFGLFVIGLYVYILAQI